MNTLKQAYSFLRWRVVGIRYLTKITATNKWNVSKENQPKLLQKTQPLRENGFSNGPVLEKSVVEEILEIYKNRIDSVIPKQNGHPFVNLMNASDIHKNNPIVKLAFSKDVLDTAIDYFDGKITLDSIQFLYSWPTHGQLKASQQWHKDFGDSKSFHAIFYLKDVKDIKNGPFTFIDKKETKKIAWSPFIRRINDDRFKAELGKGEVKYFYGSAGESVLVDPAACYHFGSRCETPRLALFITFNTDRPFVPATDYIRNNAEKFLSVAMELRPDLSEQFLRNLLNIQQ